MKIILKNKWRLAFALLLLLPVIIACARPQSNGTPAAPAVAPESGSIEKTETLTGGDAPASCQEAIDNLQRLYNPQHGYCLLYPAEYKVEKPSDSETILVIGGLLNAGDPRVHIVVEPIGERTIETVADQIAEGFPPEFGIERQRISVSGEPAEQLDLLPGQDINRRLIFTHDGLLYAMMFSPVLDMENQPNPRLEAFYRQILDTFAFVPRADDLVEECLTADKHTQLVRIEDPGYCLLLPVEYESVQPLDSETVFFVGSLLDVEHPKLFVMVEESGGQQLTQVAESLISSFPAEFGIQSVGGVTIGFQPAERLDNVPGQDISRILLVKHNDQIYKFMFVPAGEDAGELYQQMEALYELVVRSFRFLPAS